MSKNVNKMLTVMASSLEYVFNSLSVGGLDMARSHAFLYYHASLQVHS